MSRSRCQHLFRLKLLALLMSVTLIASFSHALPKAPEDSAPCRTLLVSSSEIDPTIVKELSSLYLTLFGEREERASTQDRPRNNAIWKSKIKKTANELGIDQSTLTETISVEVNLRIDQHVHANQEAAVTKEQIHNKQQDLAQSNICNRNKAVVSAIKNGLNRSCEEITEVDLRQIKQLTIVGFEGVLNSDELLGLSGLDWLSIADSPSLVAIAPGAIDPLRNLGHLSIIYNRDLKNLPPGIFDKLENLESLDINGNSSLTFLPAGAFDKLLNLNFIYMFNSHPALINSLSKAFEDLKKKGAHVYF